WTEAPVLDKDNLEHAFAAAYKSPTSLGSVKAGDLIVYFGTDRFANNGSSQLSFWFTQGQLCLQPSSPGATSGFFANGAVGSDGFTCASTSAPPAIHHVGDVLVESVFTIGGTATTSNVFSWAGADGTAGFLQQVPGFTGVDCQGPPLPPAGALACST